MPKKYFMKTFKNLENSQDIVNFKRPQQLVLEKIRDCRRKTLTAAVRLAALDNHPINKTLLIETKSRKESEPKDMAPSHEIKDDPISKVQRLSI